MIPRDYQYEDAADYIAAVEGTRYCPPGIPSPMTRPLIGDATGLGKTVILAQTIKTLLELHPERRHLVKVHRKEIVEQLFKTILNFCGLEIRFGNVEIGIEMAERRVRPGCKVVVASTCSIIQDVRLKALIDWMTENSTIPLYVHTDECHRASARTDMKICEYARIPERFSYHIGYTATPERGDRKALYCYNPNGKPFMVEKGKSKKLVPASVDDTPFDQLLRERDYNWGMTNGWLVDLDIQTVHSNTDVSNVKVNKETGDWDEEEYAEAVNTYDRTCEVISAWREPCGDRQTIVFCGSVKHAIYTAKWFRDAGYNFEYVLGTDTVDERERKFRQYKAGRLHGLTNYGVIEEGVDLPWTSCIILLRSCKRPKFVKQAIGRGSRPEPLLLDSHEMASADPEVRIDAIRNSRKPNCVVIDVYDIGAADAFRPQELIGIPSTYELHSSSLMEVRKKLDEFVAETGRDLSECPLTFAEVDAVLVHSKRLEHVRVNKSVWVPQVYGYQFTAVPAGFSARLECNDEGRRLVVNGPHEAALLNTPVTGKYADCELREAMHKCAAIVYDKVHSFKEENPQAMRRDWGTSKKLSEKQIGILVRRCGIKREEIDYMPSGYAKKLVATEVAKFRNNG